MTVTTLGYTMVICGNADDPQHRYRGRIEKVKFGVPIQEAFAHDIPATLLVLLLKVNKDGPSKKDIWRAPGNQAQVRKLSHIMQHGRLVNIANFSVYTAASVIKKFLSKLPGGIFGLENEQTLFDLFSQADAEKQRQIFCRVVYSLSVPSQHLLVLLFGTFYMISESSDVYGTKMTPDAIGISVAPSLFHTCIHDGQRAKMEDVMRFKIASEVISKIIESFGYANLFPRECYEFYARITGRTLRVDDNDSRFRFAPPTNAHEWPVPPPSAYTMMAAQCAGSYSLDTVAQIEELEFMHPNTRCFGGVQHLCTHGGSLNRGLVGQSCGTHRHRTSVDLQSGGPTSMCSATCGADARAAAVSQHVSTYVAKTMHLGSAACGSRSAYAGVNERVLYVCDLDMRESASCDF
uniref:Rho-GAP domain-containing protein n=1 Tax=Ascaris lumbricoides TaxID=6252 RepID=A0A0M3I002_ASCLU